MDATARQPRGPSPAPLQVLARVGDVCVDEPQLLELQRQQPALLIVRATLVLHDGLDTQWRHAREHGDAGVALLLTRA